MSARCEMGPPAGCEKLVRDEQLLTWVRMMLERFPGTNRKLRYRSAAARCVVLLLPDSAPAHPLEPTRSS